MKIHSLIRQRIIASLFLSIGLFAIIWLLNPLELYKEFRDGQRVRDLHSMEENIKDYIKYNTGGRINLGSVGNIYSSENKITSVDGSGWAPLDFKGSGLKIKSLPLDPVNNSLYHYTFVSSNSLKFKLTAVFESNKYKKTAISDLGTTPDKFEIGTDLTLGP